MVIIVLIFQKYLKNQIDKKKYYYAFMISLVIAAVIEYFVSIYLYKGESKMELVIKNLNFSYNEKLILKDINIVAKKMILF